MNLNNNVLMTQNQWGEMRPTTFSWTLIIILAIGLLIVAFNWLIANQVKEDEEFQRNLNRFGFEEGDVNSFCKIMDIDADELFESKGLQAQFNTFLKGESSFFIQAAISNKAKRKAGEASSNATTATVLAAAAVVNANN